MKIKHHIKKLEHHSAKSWYPILLGLLAFIYHFALIIPVDILYVSSTLIAPRRWISMGLATVIGFTAGATTFAYLVGIYGTSLVEKIIPGILTSPMWAQSEVWMHRYGPFAVGGLSLVPLSLHPLVALAGMDHMPLLLIALSIFTGRFIKYGILGWTCAYLPSRMRPKKEPPSHEQI